MKNRLWQLDTLGKSPKVAHISNMFSRMYDFERPRIVHFLYQLTRY